MSKYIGKDFGLDSEGDSYRASGKALAAPVVVRSSSPALWDAVCALHDLIAPEVSSSREFYQALLDCGGYFVCLSPS
jgi:hypothetical protein